MAALRQAHDRGARLFGRARAFVLAAAGLLDGRRATTHWMHAAELARRYPRVKVDPTVLYIDDGDILTSAGTAADRSVPPHRPIGLRRGGCQHRRPPHGRASTP